jgi:hypothetical protein
MIGPQGSGNPLAFADLLAILLKSNNFGFMIDQRNQYQ